MRYVCDGEPRIAVAAVDHETRGDVWWRATFPVRNPVTPYRWLLAGGDFGYAWLNGVRRSSPSTCPTPTTSSRRTTPAGRTGTSSRSSTRCSPTGSRSAASRGRSTRRGRLPRAWERAAHGTRARDSGRVVRRRPASVSSSRLDHISALGANVLYLTPIFPAGSHASLRRDELRPWSTRCSAATRRSSRSYGAAHDRGIRVLGDLTTNHVGDGHDVVRRRARGTRARARVLLLRRLARDTVTRAGSACRLCPSSTTALRSCAAGCTTGESSVTRRWLRVALRPRRLADRRREHDRPPDSDVDVLPEVARGVRTAAVAARAPMPCVVAEHAHDCRARPARGDGWHGAMNYAGFTAPRLGVAARRRASCGRAEQLPRSPGRRARVSPVKQSSRR